MFNPPKMAVAALERVKAAHPYAASGVVAPSARTDFDSRAIWDALLAAPIGSLPKRIATLSTLQVSLLLYGAHSRLADPKSLQVLAALFEQHEPQRAGRVAWQALLLSNGGPEFRNPARAYLISIDSPWKRIVDDERPLTKTLSVYLNARRKFDAFFDDGVFPGGHPEITRVIKRALIWPPFQDRVLEKEGIPTIDGWLNEVCVDSERVAWFRNYVERGATVEFPNSDPVMNSIAGRFGEPSQGGSFWSGISQRAVDAFERWLRNLQLTHSLGEGERLQFWRGYLDRMTQTVESRGRTAVLICFPGWFAVQFKEMGKATYMFNQAHLAAFKKFDDVSLYRAVLTQRSIGRYTHMGSYWPYTARGVVNALLELYV